MKVQNIFNLHISSNESPRKKEEEEPEPSPGTVAAANLSRFLATKAAFTSARRPAAGFSIAAPHGHLFSGACGRPVCAFQWVACHALVVAKLTASANRNSTGGHSGTCSQSPQGTFRMKHRSVR